MCISQRPLDGGGYLLLLLLLLTSSSSAEAGRQATLNEQQKDSRADRIRAQHCYLGGAEAAIN